MNTNSRKIALVTGASSGIGQATAELLTKTGYKVFGTSRRGADGPNVVAEMVLKAATATHPKIHYAP